jgi:hypothetical protein
MNVTTAPARRDELKELSKLVQLVLQGAEANQRPDLVRRLTRAADAIGAQAATGTDAASVASILVQALQSLEIDLRTGGPPCGTPVVPLASSRRCAPRRAGCANSKSARASGPAHWVMHCPPPPPT